MLCVGMHFSTLCVVSKLFATSVHTMMRPDAERSTSIRSHAERGNERWEHSSPIRPNGKQSRQAGVSACAGVSPVHIHINVATLDWVVVDILQLLAQHLIVLDLLRVAAFLPQLELAVGFVPRLMLT